MSNDENAQNVQPKAAVGLVPVPGYVPHFRNPCSIF